MENLENLKYKDLQKLAKEAGIKANSPKAVLIEALSKKNKTPLRKTSKTPNSIQKKSEIPRFVKFANAQKVKSSARKVPNFAKIHEKNFKKMESLDDHVERKKKLTDTVTKLMDKSRQLTREHTSKTAPLPKVLPKERKDIKTTRTTKMGKRNNTLNVDKESDAKPLLNITNTNKSMNITNTNKSMNETKTPSKKFDLAASLAKPLTYQPHKGKLKPLEKKRKDFTQSFETRTNEEAKKKQMEVIKGVRMNKRAELMMMRRKNSN